MKVTWLGNRKRAQLVLPSYYQHETFSSIPRTHPHKKLGEEAQTGIPVSPGRQSQVTFEESLSSHPRRMRDLKNKMSATPSSLTSIRKCTGVCIYANAAPPPTKTCIQLHTNIHAHIYCVIHMKLIELNNCQVLTILPVTQQVLLQFQI